MAPFKFVDRVSRGRPLPQYGDGSSSRDYTYISDIVNGVVRALDRPYPYQIFNLGKGSGTRLSDFIALVEKYTGLKADIRVRPDQPGDVPYTCADVAKAEYFLGYKPTVPFEEGIKRTVEWYKQEYPQANVETNTLHDEPASSQKDDLPSVTNEVKSHDDDKEEGQEQNPFTDQRVRPGEESSSLDESVRVYEKCRIKSTFVPTLCYLTFCCWSVIVILFSSTVIHELYGTTHEYLCVNGSTIINRCSTCETSSSQCEL
jgi:hypothetical protein